MAEGYTAFAHYDELIKDVMQRYHVPGLSIAIVDGESIHTKGFGLARLPDVKVTPSTLFNAASMSKAHVAASLSLIMDSRSKPGSDADTHSSKPKDPSNSSFTWQTPVSKLLRDDFVLSDTHATATTTLEDILSHRSGVPDIDPACVGPSAKIPDTLQSVTRKLRHIPLTAPPRTKHQYCNAMFVVGAYLIEKLSGKTLDAFLREDLWAPLKMRDTWSELWSLKEAGPEAEARYAHGFGWDEDEKELFGVEWPVQPEAVGAGEIITTPADYARFVQCFLQRGAPLSAAGHEELVSPRSIVLDETPKPGFSHTLYCLGLETRSYHGMTVTGHDGATNGFGCSMMFLPEKDWGIVLMGNADDAGSAIDVIRWRMVDDLLGVPKDKRFDWIEYWAKEEEDWKEKKDTKESLFPALPDPPLPLSLPLEKYAGEYFRDGFGTFTANVKDGRLQIDATDRTWKTWYSFEHVSGDFFVVEWRDVDTRYTRKMRGEFRFGADGKVVELGLPLLLEMEGGMIWLQKVSGKQD